MPEPLVRSDQVVGDWDPDDGAWTARDWTPGPAGTVGLALPGEVTLDIDVAAPGTFAGLRAQASSPSSRKPGAGTLRTLRRLLGDERATELVALASNGAGPTVLQAADRTVRRMDAGGRQGTGGARGVHAALARVALAEAATRDATDVAARALGHLDAAAGAARLGGFGLGLGTKAAAEALVAAELLLDLHRRGELHDRPLDADALRRAVAEVRALLAPGLAAEVDLLVGRHERDADDAAADAPGGDGDRMATELDALDVSDGFATGGAVLRAAPAPASVPRKRTAAVAPLVEVDRRSLPLLFAGYAVAARATTPSEAELRLPGRATDATGWWARAFDATGALVAAAPLLAAGDDAVARLLVPPEALHSLVVDLTDRPGEPRPSGRALAVLEAVAAGQAAARAERLGRRSTAARRWTSCASTWRAADVPRQEGLALEYAAGGGERVPPALLVDALIDATDGSG